MGRHSSAFTIHQKLVCDHQLDRSLVVLAISNRENELDGWNTRQSRPTAWLPADYLKRLWIIRLAVGEPVLYNTDSSQCSTKFGCQLWYYGSELALGQVFPTTFMWLSWRRQQIALSVDLSL